MKESFKRGETAELQSVFVNYAAPVSIYSRVHFVSEVSDARRDVEELNPTSDDKNHDEKVTTSPAATNQAKGRSIKLNKSHLSILQASA